jgi:hypothetical protein
MTTAPFSWLLPHRGNGQPAARSLYLERQVSDRIKRGLGFLEDMASNYLNHLSGCLQVASFRLSSIRIKSI